jgi:flagellar basal body rod protein FlgC
MSRQGEFLILDVSDRKKTLSNLMSAYSGLICSMKLNEENGVNRTTTMTRNGCPYLRKSVKIAKDGSVGYVEDTSENAYRYVYDPSHPNAIREGKYRGYVAIPDISIGKERAECKKALMCLRAVAEIIKRLDPSIVIVEPTMRKVVSLKMMGDKERGAWKILDNDEPQKKGWDDRLL